MKFIKYQSTMLKYQNASLPSYLSVQSFMECVELVYEVSISFFSVNVTINSYVFQYCYSQIGQGMPWQVVLCPSGFVNMLIDNITPVINKAIPQCSLRLTNVFLLASIFVTFQHVNDFVAVTVHASIDLPQMGDISSEWMYFVQLWSCIGNCLQPRLAYLQRAVLNFNSILQD